MKRILTLTVLAALALGTTFSQEYVDPQNVVYTYDPNGTTACVKAGSEMNWSSGSPDASGDIVIPEMITVEGKEYTVTNVGMRAFAENSNITNVSLPNTVTEIGEYAFAWCWSLKEVTLPQGLKTIKRGTFQQCSLQKITIPESVTTIEDMAFWVCFLSEVNIPSSVTTIGNRAFASENLAEVFIPATVTSIGESCFSECANLTSLVVADGNPVYDSRDNCNGIVLTAENELICGIKATTIPASVTSIAAWAFMFSSIEEVSIPNTVKKIGDSAFHGCRNLKKVTLPESLTELERGMFAYCYSLTAIDIPTSVETIGDGCFRYSGLTSFVVPEKVTKIESYMFENCQSLRNVTIHSQVTEIGEWAFYNCPNLQNVICLVENPIGITEDHRVFYLENDAVNKANLYVPEGSVEKYKNAEVWKNFADIRAYTEGMEFGKEYVDPATGITYVYDTDKTSASMKGGTWENPGSSVTTTDVAILENFTVNGKTYTVTAIGAYALGETLTSVTMPASIKSIEDQAFERCCNLQSVNVLMEEPISITDNVFCWDTYENGTLSVPKGKEDAYRNASVWSRFRNVQNIHEAGAEQKEYTDVATNVVYTYWTDETTATVKAGDNMYWDSGSPNASGDIVIPETITVDGKEYTVTAVGNMAFCNNSNITSVTIPNTVKTIGEYAFNSCWLLTDVRLPEGLTTISNGLFSNSGLQRIVIPESVTTIGDEAFRSCSLCEIIIPASVTTLGTNVFDYDENLTSLVVADGNPVYDSRDNCNAIILTAENKLIQGTKSTVIPESVTSIGDWAFAKISALAEIEIPNSVTSIEHAAFFDCRNLAKVNLPNALKAIGTEAFTYCSSLTAIDIPSSVETIGNGCFRSSGLTSFVVPEKVTKIEHTVFQYCRSLRNVTIHSQVTEIEEYAFYDCQNLQNFICLVEDPIAITEDHRVFYLENDAVNKAYLYVPEGSVEKYKNAEVWKTFADIRAYTEGVEFGKEYVDPATGITYVYDTDKTSASMKGGTWENPGSTVTTSDVAILENFTVNEKTYTVTAIGTYALGETVASITMPASITSIEDRAFERCCNLQSVNVLMEEPIGIMDDVFCWDTYEFGTLSVPKGKEDAYRNASVWSFFKDVQSLHNAGAEQKEYTDVATNVVYTYWTDETTATVKAGDNMYWDSGSPYAMGDITIPETITIDGKDYTVTAVGRFAFINSYNITSVTLPATIASIGDEAFSYCEQLTSITALMAQPIKISDDVFSDYSGVTLFVPEESIELYRSAEVWSRFSSIIPIGAEQKEYTADNGVVYTYWDGETTAMVKAGDSMTGNPSSPMASGDLVIPEAITVDGKDYTVTGIGKLAFYENTDITSVTIPATVTSIGNYAFYNWETNLKTITMLGSEPAEISWGTFSEKTNALSQLVVPEGAEENYQKVYYWAEFFRYFQQDGIIYYISEWSPNICDATGFGNGKDGVFNIQSTAVKDGETFTVKGLRYFEGNEAVTNVTIPASITDLYYGDNPFMLCSNLTSIRVEPGNPRFDSREDCNAVIETATNQLYFGCNNTVIPESVTELGENAFLGSTLASMFIPASVQSILYNTFGQSYNLKQVIVMSENPCTADPNSFTNSVLSMESILYVPKGCVEKYQNADVWKNFKEIKEMDLDPEVKYEVEEGWNWLSSSFVGSAPRSSQSFVSDIKDVVTRLVSQTAELTNDPLYGLVGNLTTLDPTAGFKMVTGNDVTFNKTYYPLDLTAPVHLYQGWTWLGYIPTTTLPVNTALANLAATEGDRLLCEDEFTEFKNGAWTGDLEVMEPGKGYIYHRMGEDVTFSYSDGAATSRSNGSIEKAGIAKEVRAARETRAARKAAQQQTPWQYNAHRYPDNTTVIARLAEQTGETCSYTVAAFSGDECRGIGKKVGDKLFITIHGTIGSNEAITFRAYDPTTDEELAVEETISFQGQCLGTLDAPMTLHLAGTATGIRTIDASTAINDVYTLDGRLLLRNATATDLRQLPKGTYIIGGKKHVVK